MVRAVEQIAQEIAALDQATVALGESFQAVYRDYLVALGQAIQTQLVQAAYHICTHGYPEQFIQLSLAQRQDLQQTLRRMGKQATQDLLTCLEPIVPVDPSELRSSRASALSKVALKTENPEQDLSVALFVMDSLDQPDADFQSQLQVSLADQDSDDQRSNDPDLNDPNFSDPDLNDPNLNDPNFSDPNLNDPNFSDPDLNDPNFSDPDSIAPNSSNPDFSDPNSAQASLQHPSSLELPTASADSASLDENQTDQSGVTDDPASETSEEAPEKASDLQEARAESPPSRPIQPRDIAHWQTQVEAKVNELLQDLSHATNQVLQKAKILPHRLPEPVLEVATKADLSSETTASPPNLLSLLIESETDQDKPSITQVMAIRLRLSEIEFGNAETTSQRSRLRQLMAQLSKIGREYQRKQREYAVVQAEAAWRSSWFEGD
ncbi:MAG: hypothetical protein MUF72_01490 [Elainella sp. Prado103]|nr:hypothetical protein [Elainella sp. Prado103]